MREKNKGLDRRDFMKKGTRATAAAAAAAVLRTNMARGAVPEDKQITLTDAIPTHVLGKTNVKLPILGYGGAALPKKWQFPAPHLPALWRKPDRNIWFR